MRNVPKELRFPLAGLGRDLSYRDSTLPAEDRTYATPMAKNVIGTCSFSGRKRGGSRPGLSPYGGNVADIIPSHPTDVIYRDRKIVFDGSVWMASAIGDHGDFDFGKDPGDPSRAVAGNVALAGSKGETITAAVPVNDAALFIATRRAIRMVSGEPTSAVRQISEHVGIVGRDAWCFDSRIVYFLGENGLYAMEVGGAPMLVSGRIPEDMKGLAFATLGYDPERNGIHIFGILADGGSADWFFDLDNKAFWPLEYPATLLPISVGNAVVNGVNTIVFESPTNDWYFWDDSASTDDGNDIQSVLAVGPFRCGMRDDGDGMLDSVMATLAKGSADAEVSVFTAKSAEDAVARAEDDDFAAMTTFNAHGGWNATCRPRTRGAWCVLVLRATGRWAYESILANIKTWGRLRP